MASDSRPVVFIASSSESLGVAEAVQYHLDKHCEVRLWDQGAFELSGTTVDSLSRNSAESDFAVLVVNRDDVINTRGTDRGVPRDNVLFELGLFMGALGRGRTFIVFDREHPPDMPSDLAGVTAATFAHPRSGRLRDALGAASTLIRDEIISRGPRALRPDQAGPSLGGWQQPSYSMSLDIATGPRDLVFAASVDSAGRAWWSPFGESGPKDWRQCAMPQPVTRISAAVCWPNRAMPHGRRDIFAITRSGYPVHLIEQDGTWREDDRSTAPFGEVAPGSLATVSAGSGAAGHLEVFVVDAAGDIHHRWANDAAKGWSGWTAFSAQAGGLRAEQTDSGRQPQPAPRLPRGDVQPSPPQAPASRSAQFAGQDQEARGQPSG